MLRLEEPTFLALMEPAAPCPDSGFFFGACRSNGPIRSPPRPVEFKTLLRESVR